MLQLPVQVLLSRPSIIQLHILKPNGFLQTIDVLIHLSHCHLHPVMESIPLDLSSLDLVLGLIKVLLQISDLLPPLDHSLLDHSLLVECSGELSLTRGKLGTFRLKLVSQGTDLSLHINTHVV